MSLKKYLALSLLTMSLPLFSPNTIVAMLEVEVADVEKLLETEEERSTSYWESLSAEGRKTLVSAAYSKAALSYNDTLIRIDLTIHQAHLPGHDEETQEIFLTFVKNACEAVEVAGKAAQVRAQLKMIQDLNVAHQQAMGVDPSGNGEGRSTVGHGWRERVGPLQEQLAKAHEKKDALKKELDEALYAALAAAFAISPVPEEDTVDQEE